MHRRMHALLETATLPDAAHPATQAKVEELFARHGLGVPPQRSIQQCVAGMMETIGLAIPLDQTQDVSMVGKAAAAVMTAHATWYEDEVKAQHQRELRMPHSVKLIKDQLVARFAHRQAPTVV